MEPLPVARSLVLPQPANIIPTTRAVRRVVDEPLAGNTFISSTTADTQAISQLGDLVSETEAWMALLEAKPSALSTVSCNSCTFREEMDS